MKCPNCGTKLKHGATFCSACGHRLKPSNPTKPMRPRGVLFVVFLVIMAVAAAGAYVLTRHLDPAEGDIDNYEIREAVLEEIDAATSPDVPATSTVVSDLMERGFEDSVVTSSYDMNGSMYEDVELDATSDDKHPLYNVFYTTPDGRVWVIYICNGSYMANPIFMYDQNKVTRMLVEDDYVTSYSSNANTFIRSVPDESELVVIKVDRIDSTTLDALDEEGVEALQ